MIFLAAPAAARISCSFFLIKQMELRYNCISNNISDRQSHDLVYIYHCNTYIYICNHVIVICLASCYCNKKPKKAKKYATLSH